MALEERGVFLFIVILMTALQQVSYAAVYEVGDSAGWTTLGNIDYKKWAATKNFQMGDTITFKYNAKFHNVMQVTHSMYKSCNASSPIHTFTTGNDSIEIKNHGHHFFFCGVPGHCEAGQKVDINVLRDSSTEAPTPSALASATVPSAHVPAPSPNSAPFISLKGTFVAMGLTIAILALA